MIRNDCGNIVQSCWEELPLHYPHIQLDEFVVMPNHIHGIIIIHDNTVNTVGSRHASTLPSGQSNVLGNIVGSFKSAATKRINEMRKTPGSSVWQSRFYDHIIRNEKSLNRIREYMRTNPQQWEWDKENVKCIGMDEFDRWLDEEGRHKIPKGRDS
jgi:REP element-mobilizing transposase RayT